MRGRSWAGVALLLTVAWLVRMGAAVWWQHRLEGPHEFFFADSHSYWHLARTVAYGEPYQYGSPDARVFRTPGYPLVLAPIFWLAGPEPPVLWGRVVGATLGLIPVGCCWWLGRRLFGPKAGWLAGLTAALYPEAVAGSIFVLSEAAFCPVMVLQMAVLVLSWQTLQSRGAGMYGLLAGLLGGLATLVRPSWFLFTPAMAGLAAISGLFVRDQGSSDPPVSRGSVLRSRLGMGAAMLVGMVLVMSPWWIRNYRVIGRFVPTTLQGGASLYDGLHAGATGQSDMRFVSEFAASERWLLNYRGPRERVSEPGAERSGEPAEIPWEYWLDRAMWDEAVRWAQRHPEEVLQLAAVKLRRMWNPWPNEPSLSAWPIRWLTAGFYVPTLLAGLMGLLRNGGRGWAYGVLVLPAVYLSLVHCIFVSSLRYRLPAMWGWMVLGAGWAVQRWAAERIQTTGRSLGESRNPTASEASSSSRGEESPESFS